MSHWLMVALLGQYLLLVVVSLAERRWAQACYWFGAAVLILGVCGMR